MAKPAKAYFDEMPLRILEYGVRLRVFVVGASRTDAHEYQSKLLQRVKATLEAQLSPQEEMRVVFREIAAAGAWR